MKTKLLKKLRKKFNFVYIPATKKYRVDYIVFDFYSDVPNFLFLEFDCKRLAREFRNVQLLEYGRNNYHKYRKTIKIWK